ncbi:MAG TPA: WYL domain-containing protein [Anaeromyxobacteraceae bacterium]|nr:WYL domain-containing protein [Anaeromyxobacteraceae bacterium]
MARAPRSKDPSSSARKDSFSRTRLLRLAAWLVSRGSATREEIYAEFPDDYVGDDAAKEKKWTRDKNDLRRLGIPLLFREEEGEKGEYVVDPTSASLPRLDFEPAQAAVIWAAGQAALRTHDHPLRGDLEVALRKLVVGARGLPPRAAALETDGVIQDAEQLGDWLETLTEAVERRKRVRLVYRKPGGEPTERRVDVYGYAWRRGQWIFVGHDDLRDAIRIFLLERVQELDLAPVSAKKPDYRIPADFDVRAWSRQEPWDYLVHEPREVRVRFRGSLARIAPQLLPRAELSREPDNARVARLVVRNLRGLVRQALAWGPEAEVVEPPEARQLAREMLAGLTDRLPREAP